MLPIACCRFDTFRDAPALNADPPRDHTTLEDPAHLDALLHDHRVDYSLCNKLYDSALMTPELLNNGLTHNEDLLANWKAFLQVPGIAFATLPATITASMPGPPAIGHSRRRRSGIT